MWIAAYGQIFFSLSIGFSIMITYASYVGRRSDMTGSGLVVGFANGEIPKIPLNLTLLKGCSIVGVFWGEFVRREPNDNARDLAELVAMMQAGTIKPLISARYQFADAAKALNAVMERKVTGKVVLVP